MAIMERGISFAGLGVMGYPMAMSLRRRMDPDRTLYVWDSDKEVLNGFCESARRYGKVEIAANGFSAITSTDVAYMMLPDVEQAKRYLLDPEEGVLAGVQAADFDHKVEKTIICSTIDSEAIAEMKTAVTSTAAQLANSSSIAFADAPVSGGPMGAAAGTLAFMVGSDDRGVFEQIKELLVLIGNPNGIFWCGPVGSGVAFKLINNYLSAAMSLASSEAMNIGVKMGLDPTQLTEAINMGGGQNWVLSKCHPVPGVQRDVPSSRDYEGGFPIEQSQQVLGQALNLAQRVGARTVLGTETLRAFEEAADDPRFKGKDIRVVYQWLSRSSD